MQLVNKIPHCLKSKLGEELSFKKEETFTLMIYIDVDHAGSVIDRKLTFWYICFLEKIW